MKYLIAFFCIACSVLFAHAQTPKATPTVYTFVEQMPEYPGGDGELLKFLSKKIKYPKEERNKGIEGRVLVRFVIMETGKVDSVHVIRTATPNLDAEAIRAVKLFPKFKPGMQQGKAVRVYYNLPIVFKLQ